MIIIISDKDTAADKDVKCVVKVLARRGVR